jgi:predicted acyltransferase
LKTDVTARYLSLDVLRGLTVALMIVVNTPGSWEFIYGPLAHAPWHGFTPTDWVFPTFLFVVGNAMSFSFKKFESLDDSAFLKKVLKRTLIIFFIGLFLNAFPFFRFNDANEVQWINLGNLRIMGVLQRIALCYCLASLIIHYLKIKGSVVVSVLILIGYWAALYFLGDQPDPYSLQGNAALKLDKLVIGDNHLYKGEGIPFDPEGILSTFPAVVNVIAGYLVGLYIKSKGNTTRTVVMITLGGAALLFISLIWDFGFPINKKIWTSAYVLHTIGWDMIVLAILMFIIEVYQSRKWGYFFEVFGRNTLFMYIWAAIVVDLFSLIRIEGMGLQGWLYQNVFRPLAGDYLGSLLFALFYMLFIWLFGYILDKKKIYIKV